MQVDGRAQAPEWFGAAAHGISFFPVMMSVYMLIYSVWWPFAWGLPGLIAFALIVVLTVSSSSRVPGRFATQCSSKQRVRPKARVSLGRWEA